MTVLITTLALSAVCIAGVAIPLERDRSRRERAMLELFGMEQLRGMTMREAWLAFRHGQIHLVVTTERAHDIMERAGFR